MTQSISQKRVLLIGGAGFIGHNLALHMHRLGAEVSIIDSLQVNNLMSFTSASSAQLANRDLYLSILQERQRLLFDAKIPLFVQDARDYHALTKLVTEIKPQVVIQLAAVSHANQSNKDPYSTFDHSLRTLENALDTCRERVEHFVYFSSSMVYGHFEQDAVTEDTPCEPLGIYGALKFAGEKLVIAYNQVFDLPYTIVRPSALYGERCVSRRVGQLFIENALSGKGIQIAGDGSDALDFTYIRDLAQGVVKVIEREEAKGEIFNLTYGSSRSLTDLASILQQHFDGVPVEYVQKDRLMPDRGTLSVEKARRLIGYAPDYPLEKGYSEYIAWYKDHYRSRA